MFKKVLIFSCVIVLSFSSVAPHAQALDISAALVRMDELITEMQTLRAEFAALATPVEVTTPAPIVLGSVSGSVLGSDLAYGSTNDDIKKIQKLLATDSTIYPYGVASGYFGPKTQEAVRSFQARFDLDTVGVVGPSTKALLEVFLAAYPDGNYPVDVLKQAKPTAQPVVSAQTTAPVVSESVPSNVLRSLSISVDEDEYLVKSYNSDGTRNRDLFLFPEDEAELVEMLAEKLGASESEVESLIDKDDLEFGSKVSSSKNADEDDAQDALDDADQAIDDARDEINDAEDDGDNVEDADDLYDEARDLYKEAKTAFEDEEYDDTVELAEEAEVLAEEAMDELDGGSNSDDIDVIEVEVLDGEAEVVVEYQDGDDKKFTVDEDDEVDIISEIADELDIDESDVEDVVEFDYGDIDKITKQVSDLNGVIRVRVYFDSGVDVKFTFEEDTDEDDIIEEVADTLNLKESDVEAEY
jgi:peptidoglycan hydrolase-like protein with peptidoglycan-binding domain/copper chaperone CopZ